MDIKVITFRYRKIIDQKAVKPWDKMVFEDSYNEFKIQAQTFSSGTSYTSYGELLANIPDSANLSGMVTPAVINYIRQLNEIVPDVLNNLGIRALKFQNFRFEIINSSITQPDKHVVAINFYSLPLLWHSTVGNFMVVSEVPEKITLEMEFNMQMIQIPPYLTIHTLKALIS